MGSKYDIRIYDEKTGHECEFAVHLAHTIPFPDDRDTIEKCEKLAVCCAVFRDGQWSWDHLGEYPGAREAIGRKMVSRECAPMKWYWCVFGTTDIIAATDEIETGGG